MFSMILVAFTLTALIVVYLLLMIWVTILICKMIWEEVTEGKEHKGKKWTELSWKHMTLDDSGGNTNDALREKGKADAKGVQQGDESEGISITDPES